MPQPLHGLRESVLLLRELYLYRDSEASEQTAILGVEVPSLYFKLHNLNCNQPK